MLKNISFLLLVFTFFSFTEPKYCKLSDKIVFNYCKQLQKEKGLFLTGKGGGMMYDIKKIMVDYLSFEKMDVEQARVLYVDVMEGLLKRYNEDEIVRPYLHNFPFTIENIELTLTFKDKNTNRRQGEGYVAFMFIGNNNRLIYSAYNYEKKEFDDLLEEPYEKALEMVKGLQRAEVP